VVVEKNGSVIVDGNIPTGNLTCRPVPSLSQQAPSCCLFYSNMAKSYRNAPQSYWKLPPKVTRWTLFYKHFSQKLPSYRFFTALTRQNYLFLVPIDDDLDSTPLY